METVHEVCTEEDEDHEEDMFAPREPKDYRRYAPDSEYFCMVDGKRVLDHYITYGGKITSEGLTCFNCGQVGHEVRNCPEGTKALYSQRGRGQLRSMSANNLRFGGEQTAHGSCSSWRGVNPYSRSG